MRGTGWLISKYLLWAIFPYFFFSWLLLSVILFVQQAGRYADIFFSVNIPASLVWQLTIALIPNVIAFTCPVAVLVGTIIGLTKMQGDSELVAIRASGVGNLQIALPIALLGIVLSFFAFFVNLKGVPLAAVLVRSVALQTAIKKLESPLEPGVFNSEMPGYTIYVKEGDAVTGRWKNIFIYTQDPAGTNVRLITSQNGRIDTMDQSSELVLENATATSLPIYPAKGEYVTETIGEVRLAIRTKRSELIERLSSSEMSPDELGLQQLSDYAGSADGKERVEANILWQRRIILSVTPFIFCLLGTVIVLRFNRGGRGFGILLALVVLLGFYLLAFLGEQLARVGVLSVVYGGMVPVAGSLLALLALGFSRKFDFLARYLSPVGKGLAALKSAPNKLQPRNVFFDLTTGIRDFDILRNLLKTYLLTLCFLSSIFLIFTAFELWKFAGAIDGGLVLLSTYLFYLLPFVYLQIAPSAAMIGTLATYVIKSRQNEIVTWTSAGQSVYRLLLPCFFLMGILGAFNWIIQERVLPRANRLQDDTRTLIRNQGSRGNQSGKYWVADDRQIYSFDIVEKSGNFASDNEKQDALCSDGCVRNLSIYEFADKGQKLQAVYRSERAVWGAGKLKLTGRVEKSDLGERKITTAVIEGGEIAVASDPFTNLREKPTHLNSTELKGQLESADSEVDSRNLRVALEKKYSTLFLPLVMALFTAPFALSLNRKGKAATVGSAVGLWLLFTGTSTVFEQLGLNGMLAPTLAVWMPLAAFSSIGIYLISRVRT